MHYSKVGYGVLGSFIPQAQNTPYLGFVSWTGLPSTNAQRRNGSTSLGFVSWTGLFYFHKHKHIKGEMGLLSLGFVNWTSYDKNPISSH